MKETENAADEVNFSLYKGMFDTHPTEITLQEVYALITADKSVGEFTEKFRYYENTGFSQDADKMKGKSLCFTPSALSDGKRCSKNLKRYTGYGMVDIDDISPEKLAALIILLSADPYVMLAHITISGKGIRVIFRTDATSAAQHPLVFQAGNRYFAQLCGVDYDPQCKDVVRLSVIAHDEHAIFNPNAKIFHIAEAPAPEEGKSAPRAKPGRPPKRYTATAQECAATVENILEQQGKAYVPGSHNEYVSCALYLMNQFGVPADELPGWIAGNFPDYDPKKAESNIRSVYQHTEDHGTRNVRKQSAPRSDAKQAYDENSYASIEELETFISSQVEVRHNCILGRNEIKWPSEEAFRPTSDKDENTLWLRALKAGLTSRSHTFLSILHSEFVPEFNPMTAYLDSLPPWDGTTDYIGEVASRVTTETPELFGRHFRKWFVGMVGSMADWETVNQTILIFIGRQGIYKSQFFNRLVPPELSRYFHLKASTRHFGKDDRLTLSESLLICLEELDSLSPSELNQLKAMTSAEATDERPAYGRNKEFRPRLASYCGTGNHKQFQTDDTGGRRILNFNVLSIVDPFTHPLPYEGLYGQALALYRSGFRFWFTQEEVMELDEHSKDFQAVNIEEELVSCYYRLPRDGEKGIFLPVAKIIERIGLVIKHSLSPRKVSNAMRNLGFQEHRKNNARGFIVVELTDSEKRENRETPNDAGKKGPESDGVTQVTLDF